MSKLDRIDEFCHGFLKVLYCVLQKGGVVVLTESRDLGVKLDMHRGMRRVQPEAKLWCLRPILSPCGHYIASLLGRV